MKRDAPTTARLQDVISKLQSLTEDRQLHWEKRAGSAHRYARWNNNLVILGPAAPMADTYVPRYLFITPFDSPDFIEVNSDDADLGAAVMKLVKEVEDVSKDEPATDPFAVTDQMLERLEGM